MAREFSTIQVASAGGVLTITFDRPDSLNALNERMSIELAAGLRIAQRDDDVRCVVLTGAGRAFCSGQDLQEIGAGLAAEGGAEELDLGARLRQRYNPLITRIRTLEKPVIASVKRPVTSALIAHRSLKIGRI